MEINISLAEINTSLAEINTSLANTLALVDDHGALLGWLEVEDSQTITILLDIAVHKSKPRPQ